MTKKHVNHNFKGISIVVTQIISDHPLLLPKLMVAWVTNVGHSQHHHNTVFFMIVGIQVASMKLHEHYLREMIQCLVDEPLAGPNESNHLVAREDMYIDLAVLDASLVDEEFTKSDRESLLQLRKSLLVKSSISLEDIFQPDDDLVLVRGVGGIGKSSLIDLYTLKWAKSELGGALRIDFLFTFSCREINTFENVTTLEQLFMEKYSELFEFISFDDLQCLADRVMIIVDGLDELQGIYEFETTFENIETPHLQLVFDLINQKSKFLRNYKSISLGRPKACDLMRKLLQENHKIKMIEVCGFSPENVQKYVSKFFYQDSNTKEIVTKALEESEQLKVMASVPVFLEVICNIYSHELISKQNLTTNTELYMYTCLIFLRNHLQLEDRGMQKKKMPRKQCLIELVDNSDVLDHLKTVMILAVETYMNNQVLFTDDDIRRMNCCTVHLERTGFIIKYTRNLRKAVYQFRHLILQEFLCALCIVITEKNSYMEKPEFQTCLPSILGIRNLESETENELFQKLFSNLKSMNRTRSTLVQNLYRSSFRKYFKKFVSVPKEMKEAETFVLTDNKICREFVQQAHEKSVLDSSEFSAVKITDVFDKDYLNAALTLIRRGTKRRITMSFSKEGDAFKPGKLIELIKTVINYNTFKTKFIFEDNIEEEPKQIHCTEDCLTLVFHSNTVIPEIVSEIMTISTGFILQEKNVHQRIQALDKRLFLYDIVKRAKLSNKTIHYIEKSTGKFKPLDSNEFVTNKLKDEARADVTSLETKTLLDLSHLIK